MANKWTQPEIVILKQLWGKTPIEDITVVLKSRTDVAIRHKANALNLGASWAPEIDYDYLKKLSQVTKG